jgi:hypothetical protein
VHCWSCAVQRKWVNAGAAKPRGREWRALQRSTTRCNRAPPEGRLWTIRWGAHASARPIRRRAVRCGLSHAPRPSSGNHTTYRRSLAAHRRR